MGQHTRHKHIKIIIIIDTTQKLIYHIHTRYKHTKIKRIKNRIVRKTKVER